VQNAKDTFYELLRQRLATLNPERTISLRGVVRPGLLVEENELVAAKPLLDCFRMTWGEAAADVRGAMPLVTMQCVFAYQTAGSSTNGGMDRGRALEQMDAELLSAVTQAPMHAEKMSYAALSSGGVAAAMTTNIWWGAPAFGKLTVEGNQLARTATVQVMSFQEAGEL
jgi:hypothetical protein